MDNLQFFHYLLVLMAGACALSWIADRLSFPPALALLVGGCCVAVVGGQSPEIDPPFVLSAVLPPLLMAGAFYTAWEQFRRELGAITSLALGAVIFTTLVVASVVHLLNPSVPWSACFTLGAIVSPPDAVAAKAILQRNPLSDRLMTTLEGESLINDASSLLFYRIAILSTSTTDINLAKGGIVFLTLIAVGVGVGAVGGMAMTWLLKRIADVSIGITVTFVMAWTSYAIAERMGGSGVLSVVTCGLILGICQHRIFGASMRVKAKATWEAVEFVLSSLVFVLIGLALHGILTRMQQNESMLADGLAMAIPAILATFVARLLWVGVTMYLPGQMFQRASWLRTWSLREAVILSWASSRGVVTLIAALALPATFPARDLIIFTSFALIVSTLVFQGGTLSLVIRLMGIAPVRRQTMSELEARSSVFNGPLHELLRRKALNRDVDDVALERLLHEYKVRVENNERAHREGAERADFRARQLRLELEMVSVSRKALLRLSDESLIDDAVLHRIEAELDLEEMRLLRLLGP
ncbi:cation:proton antiporter [Paraburkholderia strydomiana]|uniref:cation:proton antiporter n=1 Tax=Paraburkholderia strydomiana TaxID=1245417 RepID=UPI001BEAC41C|nr:sodium:proton antiporter [Paraburkholderia strydomiana]MBT2790079.1 sodium:proton antiporter [Paraburkholderia strydomiana]